ncbi:hypothetical protein [Lysobacter sp. P5_B9]
MENPYQSPTADVVAPVKRERFNDRLDDVAYGQKNIIYAILLYLNNRATARLKRAGYPVGLLGARY